MSKWVGNMAPILGYLFNYVPKQEYVILASWFPFLHTIKDTVPPPEAFLYSHINLPLEQAHQQSLNWDCPHLQTLSGLPGPNQRLDSGLIYRNSPCQSLEVPPS